MDASGQLVEPDPVGRAPALQELLDVRDGEIAKLSAQLRESQAAREVLEGEERRLAAAISTLGGRVDGECKALRSEGAGLKSAVAEREQVIAQWTERYAARLGQFCLEAPQQWFNFYPFWKTDDDAS